MKKQIILVATITLALTACGKGTEDAGQAAVETGKAALETGKAAVETGKAVVESGEKVIEEVKEAVATQAEEPATQAAAADGAALYSACAGCHGAQGEKQALSVSAVIAGQSKDDLMMKIKGYKDGSYGGPMKASMAPMVANLNDDQVAAVAEYISGL